MVLESLGEKLKESMRRLFKAALIDPRLINDLVSDIKKSLIASDVNVELASHLAESIKRRALAEKPSKTFTAREHTVNIVYEELVKFLGSEFASIKTDEHPTRILLVGLFGSGKCVHPESLVQLANGQVLTAEDIYNSLSVNAKKDTEDGIEIFDISDKNVSIPSFNPNTFKLENKRLTHLWKLKGKELLNVYLGNGNDFAVKVTPEHPFFVLRKGIFQQVRADELNEDDFVATPRYCSITSSNVDLLPQLRKLNLDVKLDSPIKFDKPIKFFYKGLPFKRNYCQLTADLKRNVAPIALTPEEKILPSMQLKLRQAVKFVTFPRYLNSELAEFLGYVWGDGHLDKRGCLIEISNEDPEIIERVKQLTKILFNLTTKCECDTRTKAMYRLRIASKTLFVILNKIFGISVGKKSKNLRIPEQIFCSDIEVVKQFIRAYFDCDAYVAANTREIELVSESKRAIKDLQLLLLRFGIVSSVSQKVIASVSYWRLYIRARYAELYAQRIGFRVKHKAERANTYPAIGAIQGCGKQDMIPLGAVLRDTRISLGFSIGEIQNFVNSYGRYESKGLISRESLLKLCKLYKERRVGFIAKILLTLNESRDLHRTFSRQVINGAIQQLITYGFVEKQGNTILITKKGKTLLNRNDQIEKLAYLESLANSDVCWLRVAKIERCITPEYVYDFTVEDNHSFIADGIIVHNTTTAGKLAKYYKKQGLKVCLVQTDTWRPAAFEQLKQLAEKVNVPFYGIKEEKDPVKILKKFEPDFSRFDVVIVDSAGRDALNKELIEEIKKVREFLKPHEALLVLSGDIGQGALKQSQTFQSAANVSGIIITKLDGTAKGGGALSACAATNAKVKFIGVGEHIEDFEEYKPKNFVSRLLGMGDLETLLKKTQDAIKKDEAEKLAKKVIKGEMNLEDLHKQLESLQKMGPLSQIMGMIPGMGMAKIPKELLETQGEKMKFWKFVIQSMTPAEKEHPEIINAKRISRIAKGSGRPEADVRELIKQYNQMKKALKMLGNTKQMQKIQKMFGGKLPIGL